jgi:hypothetical protein
MIQRASSVEYHTATQMGKFYNGVVYKYGDDYYARTVHFCVKGETFEETQEFTRQHVECNTLRDFKDAITLFNRKQILDNL